VRYNSLKINVTVITFNYWTTGTLYSRLCKCAVIASFVIWRCHCAFTGPGVQCISDPV